jgi:ABC-type transport system substrate-binding protein
MLGTKLANRYEILREIGRGGMGVVYLAHDPVLERDVAIKVVMPDMVSPESVERFKREARVVAKMDHRSIVSVYDSGEDQGSLFFVMPYVEGTNLRSLLRSHPVTLGELVEIGAQVSSALDYSHTRGIIHRDIKPENIMVERATSEDLRVRITDFGLAMAPAQQRLTKTASIVGTIVYMSPEQVSGEDLDTKTDIYSLGTVLYECLTGQPPFTGDVQAMVYRISNELPLPPRALQPQLDDDVEDLLLRCLEKDPRNRPTGKELFDKLSKYRSALVDSGRYITMLPTGTIASLQYQRAAARPFVGRDKEFGELQKRLNAATTGECQLVLIGGEAGIGKTRLLDELETLSKVRSVTVLHGRFAEIDRALPYQAYCEAIQEYFRTRVSTSTSTADFSDLAPDLISLFPVLAELREFAPSGEGIRAVAEPRSKKFDDRTYIFELLARTITRMSGGKPLVLLLEELHVTDVSVEALDYIVRRLGPTPTLIVGTYRTTEVDKRHSIHKTISGFKGDKRFAQIQLGPLSPSGHRLFLEKLMGGAGLDETLATKFYAATEGNPYFTSELVRSLIDSGGIVQDDTGVYKLSSETALSVEELPATIQQTIQERVERLPAEQREILSIASVLGKTFDFEDLKMTAPDKSDLENILEQLLISGFLEEDRQSRGLRFSFSSGVLRDVLYGTVPRLRRRMLHRKYAEELEKRNEGRLERVYGPLFEHYSQADISEKVIPLGFLLAKKSLEAMSPEDTIRVLQTVLDYLEYSGGDDPAMKGEAKLLLGAAHRMKGNLEDSLRELEESIQIFERAGKGTEILQGISAVAETAWQGRKVEESRRWVEKGIDLASALTDEAALSKFLSLGATIANLRADYSKARAYSEQLEKLKPQKEERAEKIVEGGTLSAAITSPFQSREPVNTTLLEESEVLANVFETVVGTNEQGALIPLLCERWESLNDGAMFLFVLRKEILLHDGRRLTAKEVKSALENAIRSCRHALPPGLDAIRGAAEHQKGATEDVSGLIALSDNIIQIQLQDRLPIYPALLTDFRTAIAAPSNERSLVGTGPFKIASLKSDGVVLEKNANYWKGKPPHLDSIHFQVAGNLSSMMEGFRSGKFQIVRELQPQHLDSILRDRFLHPTFVEASLKNVYFMLFNESSSVWQKRELRQALTGIIRTADLVRGTLGRLAQPAEGFLPPGIFGHDPGRRRYPISIEKAKELIEASGVSLPIRLKTGMNTGTKTRYAALLDSLFSIWSELGVEVENATPTTESFLKSISDNEGIDLLLIRWIGDYDDPDAFTYSLFHSEIGEFRKYFSSKELDDLMTQARLEKSLERREKLYRKVENILIDEIHLFPLFHDVNYRLAAPQVRHLSLSSNAPYVNYSEITKEEQPEAVRITRSSDRGIVRVAFDGMVASLDPALQTTVSETFPESMIFETLTRAESARIIPWLASSFHAEDGGRRFRFHLRDGVRFQDGRRLTSRDVRYSFERLLLNEKNPMRWYLSAIRGAQKILEGQSRELEGFHITSAQDFFMELDEPVSFLAAILSNPSVAIMPEGLDDFHGTWREGVVGTGPFRIVSFEPNRFAKLEANPSYWQPGLPKCSGLEFTLNVPSPEATAGFRSGRFSIAPILDTADAESLLHEPQYAAKYKEIAGLSTFYIRFNLGKGIFSDRKIRKRVAESLDVENMVRRTRRFATPARTLIPPALLGYDPERPRYHPSTEKFQDVEIKAALSTAAKNIFGNLSEEVFRTFRELGMKVRVSEFRAEQNVAKAVDHDLILISWFADYPDADSVVYPLLHSKGSLWQQLNSTPEIDQLIEEARIQPDPDSRHALYRQIEERIREDAIIIPLLHDQFTCFARPEVDGLELNYFYPLIAFENLSIRR